MKPSRIEEVVKSVIQTRWPVFLWGPPYVGKSSIVRSIAKQKKVGTIGCESITFGSN